ncbi:MAG: hypothetical protein A2Y33_16640 [Spirochaetes bacterium GWF1_51_8]|nr:MAG: hypothetical protein A2Y33_16640 [Spirochaetes bacterium GWF1_51_8]
MPNTKTQISTLTLERFLLGELPEAKMKQVTSAAESDPVLQAQLDGMRKSNEEILSMMPPAETAVKINERYKNAMRLEAIRKEQAAIQPISFWAFIRRMTPYAVPVIAGLAIILTVSFSGFFNPNGGGTGVQNPVIEDTTRIKGLDPYLNIYRKQGPKIMLLAERSLVKATDMLQISYVSAGRPFGMIFSIDGNGVITPHYPEFTSKPATLMPEGEILLGKAYILDDAPYFERFFFITSDKPIDQNKILGAAEKLAQDSHVAMTDTLDLPAGVEQYSLILVKEGK